MRRSFSTGQGLRVLAMKETMEQIMEKEMAEAIATINKANAAISRLFGIEEEEENG